MNMIENFVDTLSGSDSSITDTAFNNLIMSKVNTVLDIKRVELTSDIFNKQVIPAKISESTLSRSSMIKLYNDHAEARGDIKPIKANTNLTTNQISDMLKKISDDSDSWTDMPHGKKKNESTKISESADDAYKSALEQEMSNPRFVASQQTIAAGLTPVQAQVLNELIMNWHISGGNLQQLLRGFYQKVYLSDNNTANPVMQKALAYVLDKL